MKKYIWGSVAIPAIMAGLVSAAAAQDNQTRFEQLEARIAELEAEKGSRLKFNVTLKAGGPQQDPKRYRRDRHAAGI